MIKEDLTLEDIIVLVNELTDEERVELFRTYCIHCGSKNNNCQCWNDE